MKFFAVILVVLQAVLIQNTSGQIIRAAGPCSSYSTVVAQPSVANSLADTLSLLTVSSLLAESLPLNPNVIAAIPAPAIAPVIAPAYGGCGCGCGYGNRYNSYYVY